MSVEPRPPLPYRRHVHRRVPSPGRAAPPMCTASMPAASSSGKCSSRSPPPTRICGPYPGSPFRAVSASSVGMPSSTPSADPAVRYVSRPGRSASCLRRASRSVARSIARWNVQLQPSSSATSRSTATRSAWPCASRKPRTNSSAPSARSSRAFRTSTSMSPAAKPSATLSITRSGMSTAARIFAKVAQDGVSPSAAMSVTSSSRSAPPAWAATASSASRAITSRTARLLMGPHSSSKQL